MSPRVVVVGHVTHDRYGDAIVPGGSAYYGVRTHLGLGADAQLVAAVGRDFACDAALLDVPNVLARAGETTTFTNLYAPGRERVQLVDAIAPTVVPTLCPSSYHGCDLLHLAPVIGEVEVAPWIDAVAPRMVAIGVQGWIKRASGREVVPRRWDVTDTELARIDAACLGEEDLHAQGDLLARMIAAVPIVALTHGRDGCELFVRGRASRIGVFSTTEVDPTGAGDVFAAALFLALARGIERIEAARHAAAAASIVVEARGADALARLAEAPVRSGFVPVG